MAVANPPDQRDDTDPNNPVDLTAEEWLEIWSRNEAYDLDHDHTMDN